VPWLTAIFGKNPSISQLKGYFVAAALTVPGVASAQCFITAVTRRTVSGQIQVRSAATGQVSVAEFAVINPQGGG
jgi:hypothetical protein